MSSRIQQATTADIGRIQSIAQNTWPQTFGQILSPDQIAYMLDRMYSTDALTDQMTRQGHTFLLGVTDNDAIGYASYETQYLSAPVTKIHKLYVLPNMQGKHLGRMLVDAIRDRAQFAGEQAMTLNVNRHNPAIGFYERYGFRIVATEDIDIGNGYYMNDVVMQLDISTDML